MSFDVLNPKNIWRESLIFLWLAVVVMLGLALYSYQPIDPSLNHTTDQLPKNILGVAGAYVSDMLIQLLGYSAWLVVGLGALLAFRIAAHRTPVWGSWTSLFWLPLLLAISSFLAAYVEDTIYPAGGGGALGYLFVQSLTPVLSTLGRDVVLLAMLLSSFVAATHISLLTLVQKIMQGCLWLLAKVVVFIKQRKEKVTLKFKVRQEREEGRQARQEEKKKRPMHIAQSNPEIVHVEVERSEVERSEVERPEVERPEVERPEVTSPEVTSPEVRSSEVRPSEVRPSEVRPSEVRPSEVTPPEVTPPEVTPPEVTPPEVTPPKVTPPKVTPPKVTPPKVTPPEVTPPEVTPPEVTPPEVTPP
ncbi:MAG: DNA translocase FtsK 4TM domain-containing protein, partial [Ghiorsea sp.]|nr:DNA translocase FtsK 4TM domain-containing protein [Ghiorsea sp.]